jgi:hypothetical protein
VGKLVLVHDSIPPDRHRQVLNLYFVVSTEQFNLKVTPDAVLRDADYYPLEKFPGMAVNPDVKQEVLQGQKNQWSESCRYLGNRWKD